MSSFVDSDDEWEEQLQLNQAINRINEGVKPARPPSQARGQMQKFPLRKSLPTALLREPAKRHSEQQLREQQLKQDEELARRLQRSSSSDDDWEVFHLLPMDEALHGIQQNKTVTSAEQRENFENLAREQQVKEDEELARRILRGKSLSSDDEWEDFPLQIAATREPQLGQQLKNNSLEFENLVRDKAQLRRDEELARRIDLGQLQLADDWGHIPFLAEENVRTEQRGLQPHERQHQQPSKDRLVREQQEWQDEELARRIAQWGSMNDAKSISFTDQLCDLFFAACSDDRGNVGIGCVMKDADGRIVFPLRECIGTDVSQHAAVYTALTNGLDFARSMGVRRINAHGNQAFIYWEVEGASRALTHEQQDSMHALQKQIKELHSFGLNCVSLAENEEAIKLANAAAQNGRGTKSMTPSSEGRKSECPICLEKTFPSDMVVLEECEHAFCYDCLSKHVETEISTSKVPVRCPQYECDRYTGADECRRLLTPNMFDIYLSRLAEASIAGLEKVYCPFQGCSAVMCGREISRDAASSSSTTLGELSSVECMECHRLFCGECQVPWHADMTCQEYQRLPPDERDAETRKLLQLAKDQKWMRCGNCRTPIVREEGCFHMTCRCGNEFCYTCGTNYRGKEKACNCPLFPERERAARRRRGS